MSFIDDIRKQPKEKKIRLIWICAGIAAALLLIAWIITSLLPGNGKDVEKDTTLFQTVDRGVSDLKENYNKPIK